MCFASIRQRVAILAEVLLVQFVLVWGSQEVILNSALWKSLGSLQQNALVHVPSLLVPVLLIYLFRLGFAGYGLSYRSASLAWLMGVTAYLPALVARLPIAVTDYKDLQSGAIIALVHLLALLVWASRLQEARPIVGLAAIAFSAFGFWSFSSWQGILPTFDRIALSFVAMLFAVYCEEVLWRGYILTRLDQVFGRPYAFFGIEWGWGLIISSVLFGAAHILNRDPTTNQIGWYWGWGIWTSCAGLFYGLLREKTRSILAPFLVHGLPQALAVAFGL